MKKIVLTGAVVSFALLFNSCKNNAIEIDFPEFVTSPYVISGDIPACGGAIDTAVTSSISINVDSLIKANTSGKLGVNNISTLYPVDAIVMNITNGDSLNNFSNVENLYANIKSNVIPNETPFLTDISIVDTMATTLDVSSKIHYDTDLRQYVASSGNTNFNYAFHFAMRRATTQTIHFTMAVKFKIKAKAK